MAILASHYHAVFVGQNVLYDGAWPYESLECVPPEQRIEMPVSEELQLGFCIGLSLQGYLSVSVYPRMDFLMRAMDQLVNHLDKLAHMSLGQFSPKVIIRTRVGGRTPLYAGPQHTQDHTDALRGMLTNVHVERVTDTGKLPHAYLDAVYRHTSSIIVESL